MINTNFTEQSTHPKDKLYLVTHAGLSAGYQIAQVAHVVADYIMTHPEAAKNWHTISNYIIVLEVDDQESLLDLHEEARNASLQVVAFQEPDLNFETTALAFSPSEQTTAFLRHLRLAGRKKNPQQDVLAKRERASRAVYSPSQGVL
jgi:peptidyl-tRNA hydrolase